MDLEDIMVLLLNCLALQQFHYIVHVLIQYHVDHTVVFCGVGG